MTQRGETVVIPASGSSSTAAAGGPKGDSSTAKGEKGAASALAEFFLSAATFPEHVAMLRADRNAYLSEFSSCLANGVAINAAARSRVLAACWATGDKDATDDLLRMREVVGVHELAKALQLLDAPRASRRLADKIEQMRASASAARLGRLQTDLVNLRSEMVMGERVGGVSRPLCKRVAAWAGAFPADTLEFYLLNFPTAPWRAVADLCHLRPSHFALPYFLPACFDEASVPPDSLVGRGIALTPDNLHDTLAAEPRFLTMYSYVRRRVEPSHFTPAVKRMIAAGAPLGEVIWWFLDLEHATAAEALRDRLVSGEGAESVRHSLNFGKLMERLLTFTERGYSFADLILPMAESRLASILFPHSDVRVAVLGDASGSMEVAVKTASILGGLLSCCLRAELVFFNKKAFVPATQPRTAADVVRVAQATQARGSTCPAAALRRFYTARTPVDIFVLVSDEQENQTSEGLDFAELFALYREKVHPGAQVFFCSFLAPGLKAGKMQVALARRGVGSRLFPFNATCPDLSKFDSLLGMLARLSKGFSGAVASGAGAGASDGAGTGVSAGAGAGADRPAPSAPPADSFVVIGGPRSSVPAAVAAAGGASAAVCVPALGTAVAALSLSGANDSAAVSSPVQAQAVAVVEVPEEEQQEA